MSQQITTMICFYSNFSKKCKKLRKMIDNKLNIEYVSIDSQDIRKYIEKDEKIKINKVPCILILYENGTIEKYVGNKCFKICETFLNKQKEQYEEKEKQIQTRIEKEVNYKIKELKEQYENYIYDLKKENDVNKKKYQEKLEKEKNKIESNLFQMNNMQNKLKNKADKIIKQKNRESGEDILSRAKELQQQQKQFFNNK